MGAYVIVLGLTVVSDIFIFELNFYPLRDVGCLVTAILAWWVQSRFLWTTDYFITLISIMFWLTALVANLSMD